MKNYNSPEIQNLGVDRTEGNYVGSGVPSTPVPTFVPSTPLTPLDTAASEWIAQIGDWSHDGGSHSDFHIRLSFIGSEKASYPIGARNLCMVYSVGFPIHYMKISGTRSDLSLSYTPYSFTLNYNGCGRPGENVDISLWIERESTKMVDGALATTGDSVSGAEQTIQCVGFNYR